jgi:DNA-binding transcriptional LysR family regulator
MFDAQTNLDNLARNLELHETDLAVAPLVFFQETSSLFVEPIGKINNRFFVHVTHPLADRANVTIKDLRLSPLVGDDVPRELANFIEDDPGQLGQFNSFTGEIIPSIRVTAIYEVFGILERSNAIARLPYDLVHGVKAASRLVELKGPGLKHFPVEVFAIGLKSKRHHPEIEAIIDAMKKVESQRLHSPSL